MKNMKDIKLMGKNAGEKSFWERRESGLDGILVSIGLCIIALVLCVVMKNSMSAFIQEIISSMTTKAKSILSETPVTTILSGLPWYGIWW